MPSGIMPVGIIWHMQEADFSTWLQDQLNERGWDQADLVRRSGVSQSQVSRIMTGMRKPGPEVSRAIARALHITSDEVFRVAGILPPKNVNLTTDDQRALDELIDKIIMLSPENQRLVIQLVEKIRRSEEQ